MRPYRMYVCYWLPYNPSSRLYHQTRLRPPYLCWKFAGDRDCGCYCTVWSMQNYCQKYVYRKAIKEITEKQGSTNNFINIGLTKIGRFLCKRRHEIRCTCERMSQDPSSFLDLWLLKRAACSQFENRRTSNSLAHKKT